MNYSPTEVKVREATNGEEAWGPHGTLMSEIAVETYAPSLLRRCSHFCYGCPLAPTTTALARWCVACHRCNGKTSLTFMQPRPPAKPHAHACTRTHAHTHTYTYTHAHTHARTHARNNIPRCSFEYDLFPEAMGMLWKRMLKEKDGKYWRRIYKSLLLLAYLLRNGSTRVVDSARDRVYDIRQLENFVFLDAKGKDQGINGRG